MAITQAICNSFRLERLQAIHDFTSDTLKLALFSSSASLDATTTAYSTTNEVSGSGYSAGGATVALASGFPKLNPSAQSGYDAESVVLVDFDNLTFSSVTISPRGGLIYNSSKSNRAIMVLDFGQTLSLLNEDLVISWPEPDVLNAIMRNIS